MSSYRKKIPWLVLSVIASLLFIISNIAVAHFLRLITDAAVTKSWPYFQIHLLFLLGTLVLGFLFKFGERLFSGKFTAAWILALRDDFLKRLVCARVDALESLQGGHVLSAFTNDLRVVQHLIQVSSTKLIYSVLMALGSFVYLFTVNPQVTLVIVLVVPVIIGITNFLTQSIEKYGLGLQSQLALSNGILQDTFRGMHIVKAFNLQGRFRDKYRAALEKSVAEGEAIDRKIGHMDMVVTVFQLAPYAVFCIYGGLLLKGNMITLGDLMAFLNLFDNLYMSLCEIQYCVNDIRVELVSLGRVKGILNLPAEEADGGVGGVGGGSGAGDMPAIEFKNLSFSYEGDGHRDGHRDGHSVRDTLKNVSFRANLGEQIAIVGESGCGKSTLFKLVCKFHTNYNGEIALFGKNLRDISAATLRERISVVSQDIFLFPGTISENIGYGREGSSPAEIVSAAQQAHAHDFISGFNHGYDTMVGENGSTLSGGEKQRIAIARAILKDAPILLLDEPTAALDAESAKKVEAAIRNLARGKTTLKITHSLDVLGGQGCEKIYHMQGGKFIERGQHG